MGNEKGKSSGVETKRIQLAKAEIKSAHLRLAAAEADVQLAEQNLEVVRSQITVDVPIKSLFVVELENDRLNLLDAGAICHSAGSYVRNSLK